MTTYSLSSTSEKMKLNKRIEDLQKEVPKTSFCPILSSAENLIELYEFLTAYLGSDHHLLLMENHVIVMAPVKDAFKIASGLSTALTENFYKNHTVLYYRNPCSRSLLERISELKDTSRSIVRLDLKSSLYAVEDLFLVRILEQIPKEDLTQFLETKRTSYEKLSYELRLTVKTFIEESLSMSRTAKVLFIHRNTLTYRIQKIHQITGLDIRNFQEALQLLTLSYFV